MRIGIDATLLRENRYTGIENYTLNLINALLRVDQVNEYVLFFRNKIPLDLNGTLSKITAIISPTSNRVITDQIWMPWVLKKAKIDLLHCPAFPSPIFTNCPTLLTIPDAVLWKYPETISKGGRYYYRPLFPRAISKAKRIIAISNSTRKDLISFFPHIEDKIRVIYLAATDVFATRNQIIESKNFLFDNQDYILTVGSLEPRKNIHMLLTAFGLMHQRLKSDFKLVIVGRQAWMKALKVPDEIKHKVVFTGYINSNQALSQIYQNALLFVFPSIYEGFGLPILEAMSAGTPVLCSNTSSLPEVAGDAAEYADPNNPEEFCAKIIKIMKDQNLRESLIQKGFQRIRSFSWDKTAKETLLVYKEIEDQLLNRTCEFEAS